MPFARTWMGLETIIPREVKKERQIPYDITYTWNLKYDTSELICETKRPTDIKNRLVAAKGEGSWEMDHLGVWD